MRYVFGLTRLETIKHSCGLYFIAHWSKRKRLQIPVINVIREGNYHIVLNKGSRGFQCLDAAKLRELVEAYQENVGRL